VQTGEPIGSRTLSRLWGSTAPGDDRNVMADLEEPGCCTRRIPRGRLPTEGGLRLFVNGLWRLVTSPRTSGTTSEPVQSARPDRRQALEEATAALSGLSHCAGVRRRARSRNWPLKHIEFVHLGPGRALVVHTRMVWSKTGVGCRSTAALDLVFGANFSIRG